VNEDLAKELAEHFDTWRVPGRYEELRAAFAERSAEEMAREFGRAEALLQGLEYTAEDYLGIGASLVLGEARQIAEYARSACERHVQ
jgi:hypothetical protein